MMITLLMVLILMMITLLTVLILMTSDLPEKVCQEEDDCLCSQDCEVPAHHIPGEGRVRGKAGVRGVLVRIWNNLIQQPASLSKPVEVPG